MCEHPERTTPWRPSPAGATVLELLVALTLAALAATGVGGVVQTTTRVLHLGTDRLEGQQAARRALDRFVEEVRWAEAIVPDARCPPTGLCLDRVVVRIPSGNPYRQDRAYDVVFQHNPQQQELERRVSTGVSNLASHIRHVTITYLDAGGAPATTGSAVVRLGIALEVQRGAQAPVRVAAEVLLRNRGAR